MKIAMVASGQIMVSRTQVIQKGDIYEAEDLCKLLSEKELKVYMDQGWFEPVESIMAREAAASTTAAPSAQVATMSDQPKITPPPQGQAEASPTADDVKDARFPSNWSFSDEALKDLTLPQLNMLIADQAARMKVVTPPLLNTVGEAVAWLQQDRV